MSGDIAARAEEMLRDVRDATLRAGLVDACRGKLRLSAGFGCYRAMSRNAELIRAATATGRLRVQPVADARAPVIRTTFVGNGPQGRPGLVLLPDLAGRAGGRRGRRRIRSPAPATARWMSAAASPAAGGAAAVGAAAAEAGAGASARVEAG